MSKPPIARHVCGISGGKDSAALAIYLQQQGEIPEMEYYFSDTGCELPETYDFIDRLEVYLGKEIKKIGSEAPFRHHLFMEGGMLPSPRQRWCTVRMKLEPFEKFVGLDDTYSYIAIRADEHREGYISSKPNIKPVFPFIHNDITRKDVFRILEETIGIPEYYKWRSRSGCYFCFFQQHVEWLGLYKNHPELFNKARQLEKKNLKNGRSYTWIEGMDLKQVVENADHIEKMAALRQGNTIEEDWKQALLNGKDDTDSQSCLICSL